MQLNQQASAICQRMLDQSDVLRIAVKEHATGAVVIDCGIESAGGLEAGRLLAECCLAGLGAVRFVPGNDRLWSGPAVQVRTDHPVAACLAAQYAGWELKVGDYFAMGSGPMRSAANKEEIFETIGCVERAESVVGILETRKQPTEEVIQHVADACGVGPSDVTLLVAPTASQAGNVQIVARSVETTLHKMHELGANLKQVAGGYGTAPLPPVAGDDLAGIGRTNDAILYGGEVTLWVRGDDDDWSDLGPRIPSNSSKDFGEPFAKIFARYDHDFYQIDPHLFSPAVVRLVNVDSGTTVQFGQTQPDVLRASFTT